MAIEKIKQIEIIALEKDKNSLLTFLQKQGKIQFIKVEQDSVASPTEQIVSEASLLAIEDAISFLSTFREKAGFVESIANLKPVIYEQQLNEVLSHFSWQDFLKKLSGLRSEFKELTQQKEKLEQKRQLFSPWRKLQIPLEQIRQTRNCGIFLGVLSIRDYAIFLEEAAKSEIDFFQELIQEDRASIYLAIIYHQEDFEKLEALLKNYRFNFVTLGFDKNTVKENLLEIDTEVLILDDQIIDLKQRMAELSKEIFKLKAVYDYLNNLNNINAAEKNLSRQQFTFFLSGWVKNSEVKELENELFSRFGEIALFISEPRVDQEVPVALKNIKLFQPFEFITQIYGMPQYREIDPTPFLAPFFFLYFGFCVSDAGYGLMLFFFSWFVLKKFRMGPQGTRFWRMFLFCGISTILVGIATGSWFGNLFDLLGENNPAFLPLKKFKDTLVILDPLKEPTKLLGIALSFGIIQVWFGNIVAAIGNLKNKRYVDIFLDQVPMLVFLFGLTGVGMIFLKLLPPAGINQFKYSVLLGAIILIATQGRQEKGIGGKLFYGIYNLYNAFSGYLSDILSYSRLWALGLVTGVMATTINLIAVQFSQIVPTVMPFLDRVIFLKVLISGLVLISVFIFGHLISFMMNLLGAFVHPVRLQFVEFFSKFFKSGGSRFRPFKVETKYINIS